MSQPTVSVVIPAYRAAGTIARAVESVLAQTQPADEVVIVDDGSPDDLVGALREFGDRIRLIRQPNAGAAAARNRGVDESRGDLIAFLDADDYWHSQKLEKQVAIFRSHPDLGLVSSGFYLQYPGQPVHMPDVNGDKRHFGRFPFDQAVRPRGGEQLTVATRVLTTAVMVRRAALGDRRFISGLEPAEDRDLWIRLLADNPGWVMSEPLATHVMEPNSLSRSDIDRDFRNMLRVIHRNAALMGPRMVRRWEAVFMRLWTACLLGAGQPQVALRPAWGRVRRQPISAEGWWILSKCAALALTARRDLRPPRLSHGMGR